MQDEDFSAAFDEAVESGHTEDEPSKDEPVSDETPESEVTTSETPEKDETAVDEHTEGDEPPEADEPPKADEPSKEDEDAAVWKQRYKTLQGMFKAEVAREVREQLNAAKPAVEPEEQPANNEDEALLKEAMEEYPHLMRAITALVNKTKTEVEERIRSEYAPIAKTVESDARERHFAAIKKAHPDFDAVVKELPSWVDAQPAYLRSGYQSVLASGTADDVIDLLYRFKETRAKPQGRRFEAAEVVHTRRTPVIPRGESDRDDYDAAFEEAVSRN